MPPKIKVDANKGRKKLALPAEVTEGNPLALLTAFEQKFVQEYLMDCNVTAAARRAGASPVDAAKQGSKAWMNIEVRKAIQLLLNERAERLKIDQDRVVEELKSIALANILDYAEFNGTDIMVKGSRKIHREQAAAIKTVKSEIIEKLGIRTELVLHDKMAALKLLGQHLGMFGGSGGRSINITNNTMNVNGQPKNYADMPTATLKAMAEKIAKAKLITVDVQAEETDE